MTLLPLEVLVGRGRALRGRPDGLHKASFETETIEEHFLRFGVKLIFCPVEDQRALISAFRTTKLRVRHLGAGVWALALFTWRDSGVLVSQLACASLDEDCYSDVRQQLPHSSLVGYARGNHWVRPERGRGGSATRRE